tara:strand:- start:89 stop:361 length:273 start_codon:yes stop_codon:yes gene_type:complete
MKEKIEDIREMMEGLRHTCRIVETAMYGFDRDLYDVADFVDDVGLETETSELSRIASDLFVVQGEIEQAVNAASQLQSIIEEFENMEFPE